MALRPAVAGGFGGLVRLEIGYAEREALFRYHGIIDPEVQDWLVEMFEVIAAARAEGRAAGEREAEERRKQEGKR